MDVVTGATGMLGNSLVRELLKNKRKIRVLIRKTSDVTCFNDCSPYIEYFTGDVLDLNSLNLAFEGAEFVYHLASEVSILPRPDKTLEKVNLEGTKNVIKACINNNVKRLIYTSSIHIFKEPPLYKKSAIVNKIINEDLAIDLNHPLGPYNQTKAAATIEVLNAVRQNTDFDAVILCPTAILGPYDFKISNLGYLILNYCKGKQRIIIDGAYDFVDARDVAIGHILAADKGKRGEMYILSGYRVEIPDLIKMLAKITGLNLHVFKIPYWIIYPLSFIAPLYYKITNTKPLFTTYSIKTVRSNSFISHKKATEQLGYNPRPLHETLNDILNWFKEENFC